MTTLTKVEFKQEVARKIKSIIEELNKEISAANDLNLFIRIKIDQNPPPVYSKNSLVNCSIYETISY